jgi:hypothetical protein
MFKHAQIALLKIYEHYGPNTITWNYSNLVLRRNAFENQGVNSINRISDIILK